MSEPSSRAPRNSVILYAAVAMDGADPVECRVRNLSASGACIDDSAALRAGQRVVVEMGALRRLEADVMWVARGFAGLRFDVAVDLAAARRPRNKGAVSAQAGWIGNLSHAYRRSA